jgi:hypothetical protein
LIVSHPAPVNDAESEAADRFVFIASDSPPRKQLIRESFEVHFVNDDHTVLVFGLKHCII